MHQPALAATGDPAPARGRDDARPTAPAGDRQPGPRHDRAAFRSEMHWLAASQHPGGKHFATGRTIIRYFGDGTWAVTQEARGQAPRTLIGGTATAASELLGFFYGTSELFADLRSAAERAAATERKKSKRKRGKA